METNRFSVSELNREVKRCIDSQPLFSNLCVVGELSNYRIYPSGHHYFTLKDSASSLQCVMFKGNASRIKFKPCDGMLVIASGSVSVFERDGRYQLYTEFLMPMGDGDMKAEFERIRVRLESEGLFDASRKRPLPAYPERICVITSPAGAAVQDIRRILAERWPVAEVRLIPVQVQGAGAAEEITQAIRYANELGWAQVIIAGRGGGSAEDLWCFNDEMLARTIAASDIPVISGVGHEPDVTIADYAADRRASTPSNAAELAVPDIRAVKSMLADCASRLDPSVFISTRIQHLERCFENMLMLEKSIISTKRQQLTGAAASLDALSPLKVLSRGYCIASLNGRAVTSSGELSEDDILQLRFAEGSAQCRVLKNQSKE